MNNLIKNILLILLFIGGSKNGWNQQEVRNKTDLQQNEIKGNAKEVSQEPFYGYEVGGEITELTKDNINIKDNFVQYYDNKGNLTKELKSDRNGKLYTRFIYEYDSKKNTKKCIEYNPIGDINETTIYTFDYKMNEIELVRYDSQNKKIKTITRSFDSNGNIASEFTTTDKNPLGTRDSFKHDQNGNPLEAWSYDLNGNLTEHDIFYYNEKGLRTGYKTILPEDTIFNVTWKFKYDEKGNRTERIKYTSYGTVSERTVYAYDEYGNQTEYYEYNENDKLMYKRLRRYEYDKQGNWIKRVQILKDDLPVSVLIRTIIYY